MTEIILGGEVQCKKCKKYWNIGILQKRDDYVQGKCPCGGFLRAIDGRTFFKGVPDDVTLLDSPCDRCGKQADELFPYIFSAVTYRGKEIQHPWLCRKCIEIEKEKAWKEKRIYGIHIPVPMWEEHPEDVEVSK